MEKEEALILLNAHNFYSWNKYRNDHPNWKPDLRNSDLSSINFASDPSPDLSNADLRGATFPEGIKLSLASKKVNLKGALIDSSTTSLDNFDLGLLGAIFVSESESSSLEKTIRTSVFISYAWANDDVVQAIDQWLRLKGIDTKLDKRDFFAGARIRDEVMRVMQTCEVILIFLSEQSKDKPWPQFEREFASDLEMAAKQEGKESPRIIYVVIDDTTLPNISEKNRIAIMAKGKRFELVCEEIYHGILQIPKTTEEIDLSKWSDYVF